MRVLWHMPLLRAAGCGLSHRALALAGALAERGWEIDFAVEAGRCDTAASAIAPFRIHVLPDVARRPLHWSLQALARQSAARRLLPALRTIDHDLFVSCNPEMAAAYGRQVGAPGVFVCGGSTLLHDRADAARNRTATLRAGAAFFVDRRLKQRMERAAMHAVDAVVFDSETTRQSALSRYDASPRRCVAIAGGVDCDAFAPPTEAQHRAARARWGLSQSVVVAACVGRLSPEKNHELVLKALPNVQPALEAVLIAGDGPLEKSLRSQAAVVNINRRVRFLGLVTDVTSILHAADIFLFPSVSESFGCALAQAMACGLSPIALRPDGDRVRTANDEILTHDVSGILVDGTGPDEWAQAVNRLVEDATLRRRLGQAARLAAVARYDWSEVGGRFADLIETLVQARPRACVRPVCPTADARATTKLGSAVR